MRPTLVAGAHDQGSSQRDERQTVAEYEPAEVLPRQGTGESGKNVSLVRHESLRK
jgi:hypothetical protein